MLRLKGKGVHPRSGEPGDLLATVKIIMPDKVDEELEAAIRRWQERQSYNPRHWDELV
jgi:DnaJ-class molecular chaperone